MGRVVGLVRDADTRAVVAGAAIKLTDAKGTQLVATADPQGSFRVEGVAPGTVTITTDAEGYLTEVQTADVKPRVDNPADVAIHHRPKQAQVAIMTKEIAVKQQIHFATGSAVILPDSTALLTEIADAFIHNPRIHKVEVQGHADSEGPDAYNQQLSEDRANAVRTWLAQHGVPDERLVAKGYGETKPLVPNVVSATRQRNRRVQFVILEQDSAAPAGGKP
jgi:outer membrane protein OmpA-like peptidoglycan-associated protein